MGLDNGLAPNRRQAIIWANADPIYFHIYTPLGGDELTTTPAWIGNRINQKVWDEITNPVPHCKDAAVEVFEWVHTFI